MENLIKKIEELREKLLDTWRLLDIDRRKLKVEIQKLKMNAFDFWQDREQAVKISKGVEDEEKEIEKWENFKKEITDLEQLVAEAIREKDESISDEAHKNYEELEKKFVELEFIVLFSSKYDQCNAILAIHAGTGGVDAQDWSEILERMYLRFAEQHGWKTEIIDRNVGNEAGIKSAVYKISGRWVYGNLKSENGVHRLVRISPFDAENMRHTSFALVEVVPELPEAETIDIKDDDLRIDVFRSSGPGGQSVNTTDSAVRIVHKPTGITVTCQTECSQHQNKETALKILKSKLFKLEEEKKEEAEAKLKGGVQKAEWGRQVRSYVMQPYQLVKDHRTNYETSDIKAVLDGELDGFIEAYLKKVKSL
ncbi:peptide chain release factor 2 [Patescibacteria group bacterium]|nr:peptide chain release factor 2 [Patescibacteria group bacterium]